MTNLKYIGLAIIACLISFSVGRYSGPNKSVDIQKVKIDESKKTDLVKVVDKKETVLPDGTKITETKSTTQKKIDTNKVVETTKILEESSRPKYRLGLTYFPKIPQFQNEVGVLTFEKRLLSEIYGGISISTEQTIGLSLSVGI